MAKQVVAATPHRRYDPLRGQWVLVSPQRTQRPWQGEVAAPQVPSTLEYDAACYLCPGNERAGGERNPQYAGVFAFDNDYAALQPAKPVAEVAERHALLRHEAERGVCRVLCFHPNHSLTLARMSVTEIKAVIVAWAEETKRLGALDFIRYVQIFENRGAMMGASNPHPHCQVWATEHIPDEPARELATQSEHWDLNGTSLLGDYVKLEVRLRKRVVCANDHFVALVPYWAVWPFETMIISRRKVGRLDELTGAERAGLAAILKELTVRYDNLFQTSFPYTMGFHQAPTDGKPHREWHLHAHFYPPLLRSAAVKKFMVGFEMLGMPQRDLTAETAAERLRAVPARHFSA